MARYGAVWVEVAREHYVSLPAAVRAQVDVALRGVLEQPGPSSGRGYDPSTDHWTTTFGQGAGLMLYAVVREGRRVIVLRLVTLPQALDQ